LGWAGSTAAAFFNVERTLLSAAFDLALEVDVDVDLEMMLSSRAKLFVRD
jgi:hypothetical protein